MNITNIPSKSYWISSTPSTDYPNLSNDINTDILIIGGGMTGITCAYLLAKEGIKSVVIEADRILQGTTGNTTAKITSQHGLIYNKIKTQIGKELSDQYADANESAIRFIEAVQHEQNIDCDFTHQPAYVFTCQDKYVSEIEDEVKAAQDSGIKASYEDRIPFDIPVRAAIRFENQAQFHPRKYLLSLAQIAAENGCTIYEQTRAVNMEKNSLYIIKTHNGSRIKAKTVIIASHYPFYNKASLYFGRIYIERSYILAIKVKEKYPGGMYITAEDPGRSLRSLQTPEGDFVLVGGEHHKTGQGPDTMKHYEALVKFACDTFDIEDVLCRWSTQDCMTLDGLPYSGYFSSNTPNLLIATGYGKWGMTNSTASALLLRDLLIHGKSKWEDVYSPQRKTFAASAKDFIKENLNVGKELIKGKLEAVPEAAEIACTEARIISVNGKRTGAYRDEHGKLHLVNTTCPHMGCELNWNSAEKSWDCPCHGSRFTYEGQIIEGPAVNPLELNRDVNTLEKLLKDKY